MSYWCEDSKLTIKNQEVFQKQIHLKWSSLLSSLSNIFNIPTIFASFWNMLSVFLTVLKFLINYFQKKIKNINHFQTSI